jgi:hypothetical protein
MAMEEDQRFAADATRRRCLRHQLWEWIAPEAATTFSY